MRRFNEVYDQATLIKNLSWFAVMMIAMKFTQGVGFVLLAPLMLMAIMQNKTERMLVYLVIMIAMMVGNTNLMPKTAIFAVTQKGLMVVIAAVMATKLSGQRQSRLVTPLLGMFAYVAFMSFSSVQGWNPIVSYLKIFLFSSCFFAYYAIANTIISSPKEDVRKIRSAYLSLACFMLFGSVMLIPFPGLSHMRTSSYMSAGKLVYESASLFCGMTFHSQALGPLVATLFVLLLGDLIFAVRRPQKLMLALICCCPILIYKTSSRTAMGTMLVGGCFLLWQFMQARGMNARWRGKVVSIALLLVSLAGVALLCTGSGREAVTKYLLKGGEDSAPVTMENVMSTRQGLMDLAMYNFKQKPLIGNGFQVSEDLIGLGSNGLRELLTAPVEKGVWVTAILEEGGVIGFAIFVFFVLTAIFKLSQRGAHITASMLLSIVVLNLGEFTMFAMSGIGGVYWSLCFVGAVMDAQRLKQRQMGPRVGGGPPPLPRWR